MPPHELDPLERGLRSKRIDTFRGAARSAVTKGAEGDRVLADELELATLSWVH